MNVTGTQQIESYFSAIFPNFVFEVVYRALQEYLILRKQGKLEGG